VIGEPGAKFGGLGEGDDSLKLPAVSQLASPFQTPQGDKAKSVSALPKSQGKFTKNIKGKVGDDQ
jgi:hypothetical protein